MPYALDCINSNSKEYGLKCTVINDNTLGIRNERVLLDEWLVEYIEEESLLILKHMNRGRRITYHTQCEILEKNWVWILERITEHDEYIINEKWSLPSFLSNI